MTGRMKYVMAALLISAVSLYAYNPPAGGENLFGISSPAQLTSASSAAGGAFFDITPSSIAFNPALPAFEQRVMLDAGDRKSTRLNSSHKRSSRMPSSA